jgi:hypothetical protein
MGKKRTQNRRDEGAYFGPQFDARRTNVSHGDLSVLLNNHVSVSVPSDSTHFDVLTSIALESAKPIQVSSLPEELKKTKLPRGWTSTIDTAHNIEAIVSKRRLRELAANFHWDPKETTARRADPLWIKPGTRLIRQWEGQTHHVAVCEDGFEYNEERYRSLSVIARLINGTRWSGPLFFGLKGHRS